MNASYEKRKKEIEHSLGLVKERISRALVASHRREGEVSLICVTKTYPVSDVRILQELGMEDFAENRESEGAAKSAILVETDIRERKMPGAPSQGARWHYQGKIQSNKIKSLTTWAKVIHSLDEIRHVPLIARAVPEGQKIEVFIQVNLDSQPGRGGAPISGLPSLADAVMEQESLRLMGLMAVGPLDEDPFVAFTRLADIHSDFREKYPMAPYLSAGMSSDFEVAISLGATHIRVGSSILGSRTPQR